MIRGRRLVAALRRPDTYRAMVYACRSLSSWWARDSVKRVRGMTMEQAVQSLLPHLKFATDDDFAQALIGIARYWQLKPKQITPFVSDRDKKALRHQRRLEREAEENA